MNADEALDRLKQGNERFRTGRTVGVVFDGPLHEDLIQGQQPFATLLSCSDSRVPPEILFDTGLGDMFVIRVAGNVANLSSIASIEYAVRHLGTKLIVVMAHENCGAVGAAIEGGDAGKHLNHLLSLIQPALEPPEKDADVIARRNTRVSADRMINESDILRSAVEKDDVKIVTAFFHFSNSEVEFD
ncbi:MAG: carbonic anhydrase [Candidatus Krumholzibacteria bacterium]|nr:carbonic anhydrase [Candidatus Krumholzibacteria bacterium]